jgi:hypothetical protein
MCLFLSDLKIESPEQKTALQLRENRAEAILAKPTSGCARALVSLLRTVVGFLPSPAHGVGFQPTCGFEPRWISPCAEHSSELLDGCRPDPNRKLRMPWVSSSPASSNWIDTVAPSHQNAVRMKDLRSPKLIWLKGILFLIIALTSAGLLWVETPTLKTALLLALIIWAFCRAYYFAFYVLERYVDPQFRFAGLWSVARYIVQKRNDKGPGL